MHQKIYVILNLINKNIKRISIAVNTLIKISWLKNNKKNICLLRTLIDKLKLKQAVITKKTLRFSVK